MDLLLLGGMMCDERLWSQQIRSLAAHFDSIHIADLTRQDSIRMMASDALASAEKPCVMVGLSLGGIVAFECWRQAPEKIRGLVLLDTNPFAEKADRQALRGAEIGRARRGELREMMIDGFKPAYLGSRQRDNEALLGEILDMAVELGADVFERQSVALRDRLDSTHTLPTITVASTVVCGEEDQLCPPDYHRFMAKNIPKSEFHLIPRCGHLSAMEAPWDVSRFILDTAARSAHAA
ncbi:MAG: alpha/beta fold hydrolase [Woeseia sp.]